MYHLRCHKKCYMLTYLLSGITRTCYMLFVIIRKNYVLTYLLLKNKKTSYINLFLLMIERKCYMLTYMLSVIIGKCDLLTYLLSVIITKVLHFNLFIMWQIKEITSLFIGDNKKESYVNLISTIKNSPHKREVVIWYFIPWKNKKWYILTMFNHVVE